MVNSPDFARLSKPDTLSAFKPTYAPNTRGLERTQTWTHHDMKMILNSVPDELLDGLPDEDVAAIQAAIGKRVTVIEGDDRVYPDLEPEHPLYDQVEVKWRADDGALHIIWVDPDRLSIDWAKCDLVQSHHNYMNGVWCLKAAPRMSAETIVTNWDAGHSVEEMAKMWGGITREMIEGILHYARGRPKG